MTRGGPTRWSALAGMLLRASRCARYPDLLRTIGKGLNRGFVRDLLMLRDTLGFVPRTIVDAGASSGSWSRAAMFVFPGANVWAWEPEPGSFALLQKLAANTPRFMCSGTALGAENGTRTLYRNAFPDASSVLPMTPELGRIFPHAGGAVPVEVDIRRLDSVPGLRIESPALLKMDVQGAELDVLRGCGDLLDAFGVIITEVNFARLYEGQAEVHELFRVLRDRGFTRFIQLRPDEAIQSGLHGCDMMVLRAGVPAFARERG